MGTVVSAIAVVVASWLAGSIPAAYIVAKVATGKDIRSLGSGNSGATNVFRTLGAKYAVPVFLFDFLKGFVPVFWILRTSRSFPIPVQYLAIVAGCAAIAGHLFPPWIGWKGGKGVATGAGVISALYPPLAPACLAVFIPTFLITRKMSLASICTALSVPALYILIERAARRPVDWLLFAFLTLVPAVVVARHRRNILRLRNGTEERLF